MSSVHLQSLLCGYTFAANPCSSSYHAGSARCYGPGDPAVRAFLLAQACPTARNLISNPKSPTFAHRNLKAPVTMAEAKPTIIRVANGLSASNAWSNPKNNDNCQSRRTLDARCCQKNTWTAAQRPHTRRRRSTTSKGSQTKPVKHSSGRCLERAICKTRG